MAVQISNECISCGACQAECLLGALSEGEEIFEVDRARCSECVGLSGELSCVAVCPTGAIRLDESGTSASESALFSVTCALLPDRELPTLESLDGSKSHFRRAKPQESEKDGETSGQATKAPDSDEESAMAAALRSSGATSAPSASATESEVE